MKFKVGDLVERTQKSLDNPELSGYKHVTGVYRIIKIEELHNIIWVFDNGVKVNWHKDHWQIAKNAIVKQIIADL